VASEQAHFGLAQADCSVATQAVDSVPTDYSPAVGLAPAGCLAGSQAADSVLADYSAAVGSVADDCWAVVDLVPADYSAEVGSVAGDCSAARKADDHSAPAAPLDDCSALVDLVPADLAPAGCLAGPQAADSAPVDYSAAQPAVGLTAREYLRPERAGCPGGSRAGYSGGPCSASQAFPEAPS
jgi:hypothetical protein